MKKAFVLFSLIVMLAAGCKRSTEYPTLAEYWPGFREVYALKDNAPDSAFRIFQAIADTLDIEALRHESMFLLPEYQILDAEIRYKNYCLSNYDDGVMEAFRFYDSLMPNRDYSWSDPWLSFQKARAFYCKAFIEEIKLREPMEAFSDYLNALWIMEGLKGERSVVLSASDDPDYEHFTALIYDRLAWFL